MEKIAGLLSILVGGWFAMAFGGWLSWWFGWGQYAWLGPVLLFVAGYLAVNAVLEVVPAWVLEMSSPNVQHCLSGWRPVWLAAAVVLLLASFSAQSAQH